jgi:16S rRNA (guanine527-N7)-methyltransferase
MATAPPTTQSSAWLAASDALLGGLELAAQSRLALYRALLLSWNQRFNLTALRSAEDIDLRLILETMRLMALIRERAGHATEGATVVDIGSGAGIPGLPLSILCPALEVTMVEATGKKARFIGEAVEQLELPNAQVVHDRAEVLAHRAGYRESFDIAVARAVGSLPTLLELSMPFLRVGGRAFFPKGALENAEISQARSAARLLGTTVADIVALPEIDGCPFTQVVIADKIERVPARYPRRAGIPAREPLGG